MALEREQDLDSGDASRRLKQTRRYRLGFRIPRQGLIKLRRGQVLCCAPSLRVKLASEGSKVLMDQPVDKTTGLARP